MANYTRTQTRTYTKTDVKRVFESCLADIRMIAWRTAAIKELEAMEILADVQVMAEERCLNAVHVQLCNQAGDIVKAHLYTATDAPGTTDRPGGNKWPHMPQGEVRIIVTIDRNDGWQRAERRLSRTWGTTEHSVDYSRLKQGGTRTFSHGGYGLTRLSYG